MKQEKKKNSIIFDAYDDKISCVYKSLVINSFQPQQM